LTGFAAIQAIWSNPQGSGVRPYLGEEALIKGTALKCRINHPLDLVDHAKHSLPDSYQRPHPVDRQYESIRQIYISDLHIDMIG